ncbi:protein of unknown function [Burkholderia multivorans]
MTWILNVPTVLFCHPDRWRVALSKGYP